MNHPPRRLHVPRPWRPWGAPLALIALAALLRAPSHAATAPPAPAAKAPDQTIVLDPFEVNTGADTSYGALNSNSITHFNTELDRTPISADIFTEQFMQDVDATSVNDMLSAYGAGMGTVYATPTGDGNPQPGDRVTFGGRFGSPPLGVRGLAAGDIRRDGFAGNPTNTNSTSNFDIERVEVLRGPQGLLYGAGGGGGTIVISSKEAKFDHAGGSLAVRIDQYGSKRELLDVDTGNDWAAVRVSLLREDNQLRRLFIGDLTKGYYAQMAFRLPFHTTLRLEGEVTSDHRIDPAAINVNFGGNANDPRNGYSLAYLLATSQTGAVDPTTGKPFSSFGAIDQGHLDWFDVNSYAGWRAASVTSNALSQITVDTVWTDWLSTTAGVNYNHSSDLDSDSTISALTAPLEGGNPLNAWAVNSNMLSTQNDSKHFSARGSALVTKDLFSGLVKTQTAGGFDYEANYAGPVDYGYYLSDAHGNVTTNPSIKTDLGRTAMGVQWWPVDGGPLAQPFAPVGTPVIYSAQDGQYYARVPRNPKNPAWITPSNPQGLATLQFPGTGIGGLNWGPYKFQETRIKAVYFANYTSWWNDWVTSLIGYRRTQTATPITAGSQGTQPGASDPSFNLGLDGRITRWLRWYCSLSSTYNNATGFNDPFGNQPPTSSARGEEAGFKFTPLDSGISGSLAYYRTVSRNQNLNYGSLNNIVNPIGLNAAFQGVSGRNTWVPIDQNSSGVELILTASPTHNWRLRFSATRADGRVNSTKTYPIVYNDQFYTDGKGNVTYKDGSPLLVPVNASLVSKLKANADPATILAPGVAAEPLTTAMMGDPTSDYYAWGKGNTPNLNGQINSGKGGTVTSDVGNVLQFFNKPGVGTALTGAEDLPISDIQYAWPDPGNTGGFFTFAKAGEQTFGYPVYRVSLTSAYEFDHGFLKGFGASFSVNNAWQYRTFYYNNPDGSRPLYSQPELGWQINLFPYYRVKIGRIQWRTQLDVLNLTNHYLVTLTPNNGLGFTSPSGLGVRWTGQPRSYAWTNTFSF